MKVYYFCFVSQKIEAEKQRAPLTQLSSTVLGSTTHGTCISLLLTFDSLPILCSLLGKEVFWKANLFGL
jgi:hypothetical protein